MRAREFRYHSCTLVSLSQREYYGASGDDGMMALAYWPMGYTLGARAARAVPIREGHSIISTSATWAFYLMGQSMSLGTPPT